MRIYYIYTLLFILFEIVIFKFDTKTKNDEFKNFCIHHTTYIYVVKEIINYDNDSKYEK